MNRDLHDPVNGSSPHGARNAPSSDRAAAIATASIASPLPLVGRAREVAMLDRLLTSAESGRDATLFLGGEGGVGKTRLAMSLVERASQRGWTVAVGRAYPVESGIPYALFSDALLPTLKKMDEGVLATLTRGGSSELAYLFPELSGRASRTVSNSEDPAEFKTRLLWNFTQFLIRFAAKRPLLLVLENLQWADASSLELLHFVARHAPGTRVVFLCTYNNEERESNAQLLAAEHSLVSLGVAATHALEPLSRAATGELVRHLFDAADTVTREFSALLYGWTRGNPFFVEETLKSLVESGRLYQREGTWLGWEVETLELPRSVREAVLSRASRLSPDARTIANFAAAIGSRSTYDELAAVSALPADRLLEAIDELRRARVLIERAEIEGIVYDFAHPLVRDALYTELGLARARLLHASVAEALEAHYGQRAAEHADELAYHFARADARSLAAKAVKYLAAAGRRALGGYANREAADYLAAAVEHATEAGDGASEHPRALVADLARARQRLGDYDAAIALWGRARELAEHDGAHDAVATAMHRMGLAYYWSGRYVEALACYDDALAAAERSGAGSDAAKALVRLAKGMCLQELGRVGDAEREVDAALALAEGIGEPALLARANRAKMLVHVWTGPPHLAREHGARAVELAARCGDRVVECSAHWALATVAGLTGNAPDVARHLAESERLADELGSPVLRLWSDEIRIEYASATGDWEEGIARGERAIALAHSLGQRALLPRMLVWTGLIYLARGDLVRGKELVDEAWSISGADAPGDRPIDVHSVVPAHTGLTGYHLARRDFTEAMRVGERGLAIADRTGYVVWAIHRLLPMLAEAALEARDRPRAEVIAARLRRDSERLGQRAGLAWAYATEALIAKLRGEHQQAIRLLRDAVEMLEAVPVVWDAARVRRQLADTLDATGDREGAIREARHNHEILARLGAAVELEETRKQLRSFGTRPPSRSSSAAGTGGLTGREAEIARLAAARKSNKEIGAVLKISARTVSTHLSNVFAKLNVSSRGELADFVREKGLQ
ncbi:MAG: helix-turn-helix transcriptional regulator [Gemmatimonadaceae bacterium]